MIVIISKSTFMKSFIEAKFDIPDLKGISKNTIEEHIKLYSGYVKHANLILEQIEELRKQGPEISPSTTYTINELQRRFSFEFNGMVNHQYYFNAFVGGPKPINQDGRLIKNISDEWGSFENWLNAFKAMALTRGIGWAMLYYEPTTKRLINSWVDEQHLGQLNGCKTILALDMWEHSFVADYKPSGKKNYVEDFFANLNWEIIEGNYN